MKKQRIKAGFDFSSQVDVFKDVLNPDNDTIIDSSKLFGAQVIQKHLTVTLARHRLKKDNETRRAAELKSKLQLVLAANSSRPSVIVPVPRRLAESELKV